MVWLLLLLCCIPLGCNATCLRDTDCLGTSVCTENRCLLVVKGDAGHAPSGGSSVNDGPSSSEPDTSSSDTSDGGSSSGDAGN
jgi:hypothetical protein